LAAASKAMGRSSTRGRSKRSLTVSELRVRTSVFCGKSSAGSV
jgi:hypothetical protein